MGQIFGKRVADCIMSVLCLQRDRQVHPSRRKPKERECFIIKSFPSDAHRLDVCLSRDLSARNNHLRLSVSCPSVKWINPPTEILEKMLLHSPVVITALDLKSFMFHITNKLNCINPSKETGTVSLPVSNFILHFSHQRMTFRESAAVEFAQTFGPLTLTLHVETFPAFQSQAEYNFYWRMTSLKTFTIGTLQTCVPCSQSPQKPAPLFQISESTTSETSSQEEFVVVPQEANRKVNLLRKGLRELHELRSPAGAFRNLTHLSIKETVLSEQIEDFFVSLMKCQESNPNLRSFSPPKGLETSTVCWKSLRKLCKSRQNHGEVFGPLEINMENFLANDGYLEVSSDELRKFVKTGGSARTFVQFTGFTWSFLVFVLSTYGATVVQPFTSSLRSILGWGDCKILNSFSFAALERVKLTVETMEPWAVRPTWGRLKYLSTDIVAVEIIGFIKRCILDIMAPVRATVTSVHIRCNHPEMFPEDSIKIVDIFPSITTLTLHIFLEDDKWSDLFAALQLKCPQLKTLSVQPYPQNTDEMFQASLGKGSPLVKMQCLTNFQLFPYLPARSDGTGVKITNKTFFKIFSYLRVEQLSFKGLHEALGNVTAYGIMALTRLPKNELSGIASTLKVFEYRMSGAATGERILFNDRGEEFTMVEYISASELEMDEALEAVKLMAMNNRRKSPPSKYTSVFTNQF